MNFSDPFGLCPTCPVGAAAAVAFGGLRIIANLASRRPWYENVGNDAAKGAILGLTLGLAAPLLTSSGAAASAAAAAAPVVGPGTQGLVAALEEAGPGMDARISAVSRWLPAGQRALMTTLEGGARMLSGGAGERARQVILNPDGTTVIKAWNVATETWNVVQTITPRGAQ